MQNNTMTNLPQGWEKFNFDNIFYSPSSKNYQLNTKDYLEKGCIPIIDQSKKFIIGYSNDYEKVFKINNCNNSCIIFGDHTRVLKFIDFDFIVGADGVKILLNKDIERFNTKFLFFQLLYKDIPLLGYRRHFSVLKQSTFSIPPLKEQERIVGILDESFSKIDESIKILEQDLLNLDELMQSALQKAFNPLKDNAKENHKLPQGWEWKSLGEIASVIQSGFAVNKSNEISSGYIHLRTHNIATDGSLNFDTLVKVKKELIKEQQSYIEEGDILFNNTNSTELVGKTALVTQNYNYAFSNHLTKIKLKNQYNSKLVVFYFVLLLKNKYFKKICHQWIGQSGINIDKLKKIKIPLPPLQEQEQITSHLDELSLNIKNLKQNYQAQIKDLQELKNSLLDKAFKGNL